MSVRCSVFKKTRNEKKALLVQFVLYSLRTKKIWHQKPLFKVINFFINSNWLKFRVKKKGLMFSPVTDCRCAYFFPANLRNSFIYDVFSFFLFRFSWQLIKKKIIKNSYLF